MGNKDVLEKRLEEYAEVFADIVNVLLFGGKRLIDPKDVYEKTPRSVYKSNGKLYNQERDVVKYWLVGGVMYALLGMENQTDVHAYMPLRTIGYDGADYRQQFSDFEQAYKKYLKEAAANPDREVVFSPPPMYPVITLVLYFGGRKWDAPDSLKKCFTVIPELEPYVPEYKLNLFQIAFLEDETIAKFESDFRYVAELVKQNRLIKERKLDRLTLSPKEIVHAEATLDLLFELTGDRRFQDAAARLKKGDREAMFETFDIYEQRGEQRGEKRGVGKGRDESLLIARAIKDKGGSAEDIVRALEENIKATCKEMATV